MELNLRGWKMRKIKYEQHIPAFIDYAEKESYEVDTLEQLLNKNEEYKDPYEVFATNKKVIT